MKHVAPMALLFHALVGCSGAEEAGPGEESPAAEWADESVEEPAPPGAEETPARQITDLLDWVADRGREPRRAGRLMDDTYAPADISRRRLDEILNRVAGAVEDLDEGKARALRNLVSERSNGPALPMLVDALDVIVQAHESPELRCSWWLMQSDLWEGIVTDHLRAAETRLDARRRDAQRPDPSLSERQQQAAEDRFDAESDRLLNESNEAESVFYAIAMDAPSSLPRIRETEWSAPRAFWDRILVVAEGAAETCPPRRP